MAFIRHLVAEKMNALSGRCSQTLGLKLVRNRTLALSSWREETQASFAASLFWGHEFSSIDCVVFLVFGWGFWRFGHRKVNLNLCKWMPLGFVGLCWVQTNLLKRQEGRFSC